MGRFYVQINAATHERKKNRYDTLRADCVEKGWICHVIPNEVGCRGYREHSVISFLSKIGITGRSSKSSSDGGAICIKLDSVESETFSARMKYTRNHHSRVITLETVSVNS